MKTKQDKIELDVVVNGHEFFDADSRKGTTGSIKFEYPNYKAGSFETRITTARHIPVIGNMETINKVHDQLDAATMWVDENYLLHLTGADGHEFYTVDFSSIVPEGWFIKVQGTWHNRTIAFIMADDASILDKAHVFTGHDLHEAEDILCSQKMTHYSMSSNDPDPEVHCERPENHYGKHQNFTHGSCYWSKGGGSPNMEKIFGFPVSCHLCGYVQKGDVSGDEVTCKTCGYWLEQISNRRGAFVIDGDHYRAGGGGGFGGRDFKIELFDGTEYKGNLWHQGDVPAQFASQLPNTGKFVKG